MVMWRLLGPSPRPLAHYPLAYGHLSHAPQARGEHCGSTRVQPHPPVYRYAHHEPEVLWSLLAFRIH